MRGELDIGRRAWRNLPGISMCAVVCVSGLCWALAANAAWAEDFQTPETAVESGREALDAWWDYPWYDSSTDSLRRVAVKAPRPRTTSSRGQWNWDAGEDLVRMLGWGALIGLLALIAYLLIRIFLEQETADAAADSSRKARREEIDRVEALPFDVGRPKSDLLTEAQRCHGQGDFSGAIIYYFSYQLVQLDKAHVIRLTRGRTNRQYVRQARKTRPELAEILQRSMALFEDVYFGRHPLDRVRFESVWTASSRFADIAREVVA